MTPSTVLSLGVLGLRAACVHGEAVVGLCDT